MLLKTWDSEEGTGKLVSATVVLSREEIDLILGNTGIDEFGMSAWDRFIREERVDLCEQYKMYLQFRDEMRQRIKECTEGVNRSMAQLLEVDTEGK